MNLQAALKQLGERARTDEALLQEMQNDPEGVLLTRCGSMRSRWATTSWRRWRRGRRFV